MGYCKVCGKLVPIRPGELKYPQMTVRGASVHVHVPMQRWWWPSRHDNEEGADCLGYRSPI